MTLHAIGRTPLTPLPLEIWVDPYPPSLKNAFYANDLYMFVTLPESPAVDQQSLSRPGNSATL